MDRAPQDSPRRITTPPLSHHPAAETSTQVPQTPRRHKPTQSSRRPGIRTNLPTKLSVENIKTRLKTKLNLNYTPDEWQAHLIRHVLEGYDSILCAGTGYGKSLVFEGLAALGGKNKTVLVVSPLKALERDQAQQATDKGLHAVVLNEDTTKTAGLWQTARTKANLIYLSPEMALSSSFLKLWKDSKFRKRLTAVVVDEAHCVDEWGGDDFRPQYRQLHTLRHFTGHSIPFLACTATCTTSTFDLLWTTLSFGHRPFWGLDVGTDRPNLLFLVRELTSPKMPMLDILNLLPRILDERTKAEDLPKCIFYFDSELACRVATQFLRRCLPPHLRSCVHAFSSDLSEAGKQACWDLFLVGKVRILIATDAAGMGCNVPDIQYVVSFGVPKSLSSVAQRWGRAGRDRTTQATCLLLVPPWVVRPLDETLNPALNALRKGRKGKLAESKQSTTNRAKLDKRLERFFNLRYDQACQCEHKYLREVFRPQTNITTYTCLEGTGRRVTGSRSTASHVELSWTVIDLPARNPPPQRCCCECNPGLLSQFQPAEKHDPRLHLYSADFLFAAVSLPSRPPSAASVHSSTSTHTNISTASQSQLDILKLSPDDLQSLRTKLIKWRSELHQQRGAPRFLSASIYFPPKQLNELVGAAGALVKAPQIDAKFLRKRFTFDLLSDSDLDGLAVVLAVWKLEVASLTSFPQRTPQSQRRSQKKQRTPIHSQSRRIPQPSFSPASSQTPQASQTPKASQQSSNIFALSLTSSPSHYRTPGPSSLGGSYYRLHAAYAGSASSTPSNTGGHVQMMPPPNTTRSTPRTPYDVLYSTPQPPQRRSSAESHSSPSLSHNPYHHLIYETPQRLSFTPSATQSSSPFIYYQGNYNPATSSNLR